jgi:hypothetical protein
VNQTEVTLVLSCHWQGEEVEAAAAAAAAATAAADHYFVQLLYPRRVLRACGS